MLCLVISLPGQHFSHFGQLLVWSAVSKSAGKSQRFSKTLFIPYYKDSAINRQARLSQYTRRIGSPPTNTLQKLRSAWSDSVDLDTGYPHDGRADNTAYRHDRRADKRRYPHDREIDIQMSRNGYV